MGPPTGGCMLKSAGRELPREATAGHGAPGAPAEHGPRVAVSLDARVVSLLEAGDPRTAATLAIDEYGGGVRRFLSSALADPTLADDGHALFCECVWRAIGSYAGRSSVRVWCFGVACNVVHRLRDDAWRRRARRLSTGTQARLPAPSAQVDDDDDARRRASALAEVRRELSDADRMLLALRAERDLDWESVQAMMHLGGHRASVVALRKRYERLRERLRRSLRQHGVSG